jgi:uncharacterized membrane protein YoaK (UPF0700 family)
VTIGFDFARSRIQSVESVPPFSLAMGMLNPALSKVGAESVSLTFVTGTLNRVGASSLQPPGGSLWRRDMS